MWKVSAQFEENWVHAEHYSTSRLHKIINAAAATNSPLPQSTFPFATIAIMCYIVVKHVIMHYNIIITSFVTYSEIILVGTWHNMAYIANTWIMLVLSAIFIGIKLKTL